MADDVDLNILPAYNERASIAARTEEAFGCSATRRIRAEALSQQTATTIRGHWSAKWCPATRRCR
jgi:hypothetical protein